MKDVVLALDPATQSGYAAGNGASFERGTNFPVESGVVRMPKRPILGERLLVLFDMLNELIDHYKPVLIAYEKPYWPQPRKAKPAWVNSDEKDDEGPKISAANLQFLQKIEGLIELTTARRNLPYEAYYSSSWRVTALGYGRAPKGSAPGYLKQAMVRRAQALGYKPRTEDEADAIGILMHATMGKPAAKRAQFDLLDAPADL